MAEDSFKNSEIKSVINSEYKDVSQHIKQIEAVRRARAVVDQTFTSIETAQEFRAGARDVRNKFKDGSEEGSARDLEKDAARGIISARNTPIYER